MPQVVDLILEYFVCCHGHISLSGNLTHEAYHTGLVRVRFMGHCVERIFEYYRRILRRSREFVTTLTLESAMQALESPGLSIPAAARGTKRRL